MIIIRKAPLIHSTSQLLHFLCISGEGIEVLLSFFKANITQLSIVLLVCFCSPFVLANDTRISAPQTFIHEISKFLGLNSEPETTNQFTYLKNIEITVGLINICTGDLSGEEFDDFYLSFDLNKNIRAFLGYSDIPFVNYFIGNKYNSKLISLEAKQCTSASHLKLFKDKLDSINPTQSVMSFTLPEMGYLNFDSLYKNMDLEHPIFSLHKFSGAELYQNIEVVNEKRGGNSSKSLLLFEVQLRSNQGRYGQLRSEVAKIDLTRTKIQCGVPHFVQTVSNYKPGYKRPTVYNNAYSFWYRVDCNKTESK